MAYCRSELLQPQSRGLIEGCLRRQTTELRVAGVPGQTGLGVGTAHLACQEVWTPQQPLRLGRGLVIARASLRRVRRPPI